jgi:hypothetical protein
LRTIVENAGLKAVLKLLKVQVILDTTQNMPISRKAENKSARYCVPLQCIQPAALPKAVQQGRRIPKSTMYFGF